MGKRARQNFCHPLCVRSSGQHVRTGGHVAETYKYAGTEGMNIPSHVKNRRSVVDIEQLKVAVAVCDDLATWQRLNVTAFVISGIGPSRPELVGDEVVDADGCSYLPKLRLPILVYGGDRYGVRRAFDRALARELDVSVYTDELFSTENDSENRAAIRRVATSELQLSGFAVVGPRRDVDKVFDKLRFHP